MALHLVQGDQGVLQRSVSTSQAAIESSHLRDLLLHAAGCGRRRGFGRRGRCLCGRRLSMHYGARNEFIPCAQLADKGGE